MTSVAQISRNMVFYHEEKITINMNFILCIYYILRFNNKLLHQTENVFELVCSFSYGYCECSLLSLSFQN